MVISNVADPLAVLPESLRLLGRSSEIRRFRKGHLLIQEGDRGDTLYIVLAGRLRIFGSATGQQRDREITYGTYGVGEYVGEMSLDGGPRSANVEALEPSTCALVTRSTLLKHISMHPEFALELLSKVIRRARTATLSAKQLALNDVYGRLVQLLNELSVPQADGSRRLAERLTHREIANRVGCSREMISRLMRDLESGDFVRVTDGALQLSRQLPMRW